jgi:phosphoribosyl 1,2-cyclic phosphate phosphodiesterase
MTVFGFLINDQVAYVTDCNAVPAEVVESIRGVTLLVLDALRHRPHPTHLNVEQALAVAAEVSPKLTLLTHACHELDHAVTESALPANVRVAYDNLVIEVEHAGWRMATETAEA